MSDPIKIYVGHNRIQLLGADFFSPHSEWKISRNSEIDTAYVRSDLYQELSAKLRDMAKYAPTETTRKAVLEMCDEADNLVNR